MSPPPLLLTMPRLALPCPAAFRNRSHNPIAQLDPFDPPHRHRISFDGISIFHFGSEFVTYRPRPLCNPRGWHRSSACSSQFQLPHSPCYAARYQHCSLSRKMPTKHKIYLRGQRVEGVRRGGGGVDEESLRFRFQFGTESPRLC